jgi:hypothetical protein
MSLGKVGSPPETRGLIGTQSNVFGSIGSFLDRRNLCAHPSDYYPNLNMTLGYIAEILKAIEGLQKHAVA